MKDLTSFFPVQSLAHAEDFDTALFWNRTIEVRHDGDVLQAM